MAQVKVMDSMSSGDDEFKRVGRRARVWLRAGVLGCALWLLAGCETASECSLTCRLWKNDDMSKWSEPTPGPDIAFFQVGDSEAILVQYDAFSERHSRVERRAFYLESNRESVEAGRKPQFVPMPPAESLRPIPVVIGTNAPPFAPGATQYWARVSKEGKAFRLYRGETCTEEIDLPVYQETAGTAWRVVLTPLAVAGDTAVVVSVVGLVAFVIWVESGAPTH